jgi:hypothetical protein
MSLNLSVEWAQRIFIWIHRYYWQGRTEEKYFDVKLVLVNIHRWGHCQKCHQIHGSAAVKTCQKASSAVLLVRKLVKVAEILKLELFLGVPGSCFINFLP